jgi:uncharacterized protein (TIGR02268 family)
MPALALAILAAAAAAAQPLPAAQERRVVLTGEATAQAEALHLGPGVVTVLLFEAALERGAVRWEGPKDVFARFVVTEREILLEPRPTSGTDSRLGVLQVHFAEGALVESADFALVLAPTQVDRQVRVVHQPTSPAVWQAALARERARCASKDEELAALREKCEGGSLISLVRAGVLGEEGVTFQPSAPKAWKLAPGLEARTVQVYGARGRMAVAFWLGLAANAQPWTAGEPRVTYTGTETRPRVLDVYLEKPRLAPGEETLVAVEWDASPGGDFTLEVPERDGSRAVRVPGLKLR